MKKACFIFLLSLITLPLFSQDIYEDFGLYFGPFKKRHEVDLKHLQLYGFQDIYNYDEKDFIKNNELNESISKIEYVSIKIKENQNLDNVIAHLKLIPNLKFVKFSNSFFLKKSVSVNNFPKELKTINSIETIVFDGDYNWDWNFVFNELSQLPNFRSITFISNSEEVLMVPSFLKLKSLEGLMISRRSAPKLPEHLKALPKLKTIAIYCDEYPNLKTLFSQLQSIPKLNNLLVYGGIFNDTISKSFKHFHSLKKLALFSSQFENPELFFESLGENNKLIELKLSNNKLNFIPKNIKLLDSLKVFFSSNNIKTTTLPSEFYTLNNLEFIEIQGSEIEIIDQQINLLKKLKTLNIYFNRIKYLPSNISGLENLKTLNIRRNAIKTLPIDIGLLKNLNELNAGNNQLTFLPENIHLLKNLKELNLEKNYLAFLPKHFGKLKNLKNLNLENNKLEHLPNSFSSLLNLKYLNLSGNDLYDLPKKIGKLKSLENLNLNSNFLNQLSANFGKLSNLKNLNLSHNNLSKLPTGFGKLSKLESLYFSNRENYKYQFFKYNHITGVSIKDSTKRLNRKTNEIIKLSNDFYKLKSLKTLDISYNTKLNSFHLFEILKKSSFNNYNLNLSNCNISILPTEGWDKISVKTLDISNNKIDKIPKDIKNAPYLSYLNLSKNFKFNTIRDSKEQISLLLLEENILGINDLPKNAEMAIAFAEVSNKKNNSKEFDKSIYYADKAIEIDSTLALKKLFIGSFIESLYKTKNYKRAIHYANAAIKKDTSSNIRFLNSILPNFNFKAKSQLAINDTLGAIKTLVIASEKFNSNNWSEAGLLAKKIGLDSLAKKYFYNSFSYYEEYLNHNPNDILYKISYLEACIVAGEIKKAKSIYNALLLKGIKEENFKALLDFFRVIFLVIEDNPQIADEIIKYKETNNNIKAVNNWSFQLFLDWNKLNKLSIKQKLTIEDLLKYVNVLNQ